MAELHGSGIETAGRSLEEVFADAEQLRIVEYETEVRRQRIANAVSDLAFSYKVLSADMADESSKFMPNGPKVAISKDLALFRIIKFGKRPQRGFSIEKRNNRGCADTPVLFYSPNAQDMAIGYYEFEDIYGSVSDFTSVTELSDPDVETLVYRSRTLFDYLNLSDYRRHVIHKYDERHPR